jgi:predicted RNA binding protein YcfA (HicA-like mRNA interferase family)
MASVKARRLLAALLRIGWTVAWQNGSHRRLHRDGWANYTFAFHDGDEVGGGLLSQIAKKTGLRWGIYRELFRLPQLFADHRWGRSPDLRRTSVRQRAERG